MRFLGFADSPVGTEAEIHGRVFRISKFCIQAVDPVVLCEKMPTNFGCCSDVLEIGGLFKISVRCSEEMTKKTAAMCGTRPPGRNFGSSRSGGRRVASPDLCRKEEIFVHLRDCGRRQCCRSINSSFLPSWLPYG